MINLEQTVIHIEEETDDMLFTPDYTMPKHPYREGGVYDINGRFWKHDKPPIMRSRKVREIAICTQCGNAFQNNGCICAPNTQGCISNDKLNEMIKNSKAGPI